MLSIKNVGVVSIRICTVVTNKNFWFSGRGGGQIKIPSMSKNNNPTYPRVTQTFRNIFLHILNRVKKIYILNLEKNGLRRFSAVMISEKNSFCSPFLYLSSEFSNFFFVLFVLMRYKSIKY